MILPETWLPTCTVITAFRLPVVVTVESISPRSTRAVIYSGTRELRERKTAVTIEIVAAAPTRNHLRAEAYRPKSLCPTMLAGG